MPLPLPILDDRSFEELAEEAVRTAVRRSPRWTDHNLHDPGVTFLDLFAWLAEQQLYYLDRIRPDHERKFLRLLGTAPRTAEPARLSAVLGTPSGLAELDGERVPRGTRIEVTSSLPESAAGDEIVVFETAEDVTLTAARVVEVVTSSPEGLVDREDVHRREGISFPAFGDPVRAGNRLYLGLDRELPAGAEVALDLTLFEDYRDARGQPVLRGGHVGEPWVVVSSAQVVWEHSTASASDPWQLLEVLEDGTRSLSHGGRLHFHVPADLASRPLPPVVSEARWWLRATVRERGRQAPVDNLCAGEVLDGRPATARSPGILFELAPRLEEVRLNTVPAVEGETLSEVVELSATGAAALQVSRPDALALVGERSVQVQEADGRWRDRPDAEVKKLPAGDLEVRFGEPPPVEGADVRLVAWRPDFAPRRRVGAGDGLPDQNFSLGVAPVVPSSLRVQVGERDGGAEGELLWRDWLRVDDFDASDAADPHYMLDPAVGRIRFGDGRRGAVVPPAAPGTRNVRVISLRVGGGERGDVPAGSRARMALWRLQEDQELPVEVAAVTGGAEPESLDETWRRVRRESEIRHRAVTDGDFEILARATPGLRVARAKALPLFSPDSPEEETPATVTVVVVPFTEGTKPIPSGGFLRTVCNHLDRHRLITTDLRVVAPDYVEVAVEAHLRPAEGFPGSEVQTRAVEALDHFLDPLAGGPDGDGWPFGRPVHPSEIYEALEAVDGVDCAEGVRLTVSSDGAGRGARGEITLPPTGLVCSGTHRLTLAPPPGLCREKGCSS